MPVLAGSEELLQRKPKFKTRREFGPMPLLFRASLPFLCFWTLWSVPLISLGMGMLGTERASFLSAVAGGGTTLVLFGQLSRRRSALYILPVPRKRMADWLWLVATAFPVILILLTFLFAHCISLRIRNCPIPWKADATLILVLPMVISALFLPWLLAMTRVSGHRRYEALLGLGGLVLFGYLVSIAAWPLSHKLDLRWSSIPVLPTTVLTGTVAVSGWGFLRREWLVGAIYQRLLETDDAHASKNSTIRQFQSRARVVGSAALYLYKIIVLISVSYAVAGVLGKRYSEPDKPIIWALELYHLSISLLAGAAVAGFIVGTLALRQWRLLTSLPLNARQRVRLLEMAWAVMVLPPACCAALSAEMLTDPIQDIQWMLATYFVLLAAFGPLYLAQNFWRPRWWWLLLFLAIMLIAVIPFLPNTARFLLVLLLWLGGHAWLRYSVAYQRKPNPQTLRLWGVGENPSSF